MLKDKIKVLCILHRSPPMHGAAKVGDFIASSEKLKEHFNCKFITIKSSDTVADIGSVSMKKIYYFVKLYSKVFFSLLTFKPDKIYFTASVQGVAFYRDLLVSSLWKMYKLCKPVDVYYHYHTKGIGRFASKSNVNLKLSNFFIKGANLILLSPLLKKDVECISTYKSIFFLPNGIESEVEGSSLEKTAHKGCSNNITIKVLYLAHMMKDKGYWDVLTLANECANMNVHFNFAGSWTSDEDEVEFFNYIKENSLESVVSYHGFVSGAEKALLFKNSHLLIYPSKNDAFPLTLLEALSYGLPVIATDEGSIPYILDEKSGVIINNTNKLLEALDEAKNNLLNKETAMYCRQRYLDHFSLEQFEVNLVKVLK